MSLFNVGLCWWAGIRTLNDGTHPDIAAHFFDGIIAGTFGQNIREQGLYSNSTGIVVHAELVDEQRFHRWHIQFRQTFAQKRFQMVEGFFDALIDVRITSATG